MMTPMLAQDPGEPYTIIVAGLLLLGTLAGVVCGFVSWLQGFYRQATPAKVLGWLAIASGVLWIVITPIIAAVWADRPVEIVFRVLLFAGWWGLLPIAIGSLGLWIASRRAWEPGHCFKCNYDLRGSPNSAACPECGAGIAGRACGALVDR